MKPTTIPGSRRYPRTLLLCALLLGSPLSQADAEPDKSPSPIQRRKADPNSPSLPMLAWEALKNGRWEEAHRLYARQLTNAPTDLDAQFGLLFIETRHAEAMESKAHRPTFSTTITASYALPQTLSAQAQLEQVLRSALQHTPKAAIQHFALGTLLARQQRWREAHDAYQNAVIYAPEHPDYRHNFAVSLAQLGEHRQARQEFERALLLRTHYPAAFAQTPVMDYLAQH